MILVMRRGRHHAAADDGAVFVVENRELARCDTVGRLVELERESVGPRQDARGDRCRAVAELGVGAVDRSMQARRSRRRPCEPASRAARRRACWSRVGAQRVQRLGRGDADPAPLAGRVAPDAVVPAELRALLVDDRALRAVEATPLEEGAIVVARRGSTPPGSRGAPRRRALRRLPPRASRPSSARRAGTRSARASRGRAARACTTGPCPDRLRARAAAGRRARRFVRNGPSRACGAPALDANASSSSKRKLPLQRPHGFGVSPRAYPWTNGSTTARRNSSRRSSVTCGRPSA